MDTDKTQSDVTNTKNLTRSEAQRKPNSCPSSFPLMIPKVLLKDISICTLGMFQTGFQLGVFNLPYKLFQQWIVEWYIQTNRGRIDHDLTQLILTIIISLYPIGALIGTFMAMRYYNKEQGLRKGLICSNLFALVAHTLFCMTNYLYCMSFILVGRLLIGVCCGLQSVLIPLYLAEISTLKSRITIFGVCESASALGILISQFLGQQNFLGSPGNWAYLLCLPSLFMLIQLYLLHNYPPEFPRQLLIEENKIQEARGVLEKLCHRRLEIEEEICDMINEVKQLRDDRFIMEPFGTIGNAIRSHVISKQLILSCIIQVSQQITPFNLILFYSSNIIDKLCISKESTSMISLCTGCTMFLTSLVYIALEKRCYVRTLYINGLIMIFLSSCLLSINLLMIPEYHLFPVYFLLFSIGNYIGPGPLSTLCINQLYTQAARPAAVSTCLALRWFCTLMIAVTFQPLLRILNLYLFIPFTLITLSSIIYMYIKLPETKHLSFWQIYDMFKGEKSEPNETEMEEILSS